MGAQQGEMMRLPGRHSQPVAIKPEGQAGKFDRDVAFRKDLAGSGMHVHAASLVSIQRNQSGLSRADSQPRPTPMLLAAMSKTSPWR